jgi:hypothetical protein
MNKNQKLSNQFIQNKIYYIRGTAVMLDSDLAVLYSVETKNLKRQVKRNIERFPDDFMFQLTKEEFKILRCQIVTSNRGGTRYLPYVFTEQGVAMLSSVLKSDRAIQVNIQIMRTFSKLRKYIFSHEEIKKKIENLEKKYDKQFKIVFTAIQQLMSAEDEKKKKPKRKIGFNSIPS